MDMFVTSRCRQRLPKRWNPELIMLMSSCWALDHTARPEFRQLVPQLQQLRDVEEAAEAGRSNMQLWRRAIYP